MPDIAKNFRHIHLVGSGGVGMFAIGGILLEQGVTVSGSDLEKNPKSEFLSRRGAFINYGHRAENLPHEADALIYTSAAGKDNPEIAAAASLNIPCYRRGQFLAEEIVPLYKTSVAVAGSHGKSTVSAMIVHALRNQNVNTGCLIGGSLQNGALPFASGDGSIFVTEADESDNSHALLHPAVGIITNYDADHAWTEEMEREQFEKFRSYCLNSKLILHYDIPELNVISAPFADKRILVDREHTVKTGFYGFMHTNAVLALSVLKELGYDCDPDLLADFKGVDRRMTVHAESSDAVLIEDYAHHPAELNAALDYLHEKYPNYKINIIFQPHRFARLKKYFDDFVAVLNSKADKVFVVPVFAAWNESGFPDSGFLAESLQNGCFLSMDDIGTLRQTLDHEEGEKLLVAVVGAGDVEKLIPVLKEEMAGNV